MVDSAFISWGLLFYQGRNNEYDDDDDDQDQLCI